MLAYAECEARRADARAGAESGDGFLGRRSEPLPTV